MPAYRYTAVDQQGKEQRGVIEADGAKTARSLLRARGLLPIATSVVGQSQEESRGLTIGQGLPLTQLTTFTRQFASLLQSGLPIDRALVALSEDAESPRLREILTAIRSDVASGSTLGVGMRRFPKVFSELYLAIVEAGEEAGDLALVLTRLADYLEGRDALRGKLIQAFTYPVIVAGVALLVITLLLAYVVPQVVGVFAGAKQKLPILTVALIFISDIIRNYWYWMLGLLALVTTALWQLYLQPSIRRMVDSQILAWPLIGRLSRSMNTARFASTLSILVAAGVPILRSLEAAGATLSNAILVKDAEQALDDVREGATLAAALGARQRFPKMLVTFVKLGEQTGQLAQMLDRSAQQHAQEVQRRAMALTTLLEPLLILVMGLLVLLIVLAVLLPIIQINSLVR